jgi:hypothetical protein
MDIRINDYQGFGDTFLREYLADGMATMTKREIDILVMHLLMDTCGLANASNYDLSIKLKLSESRVKSLRYEARLKYPISDTYVQDQLLIVLHSAQFELDKNDQTNYEKMKVSFVCEDVYLRHALQGILKSQGRFADTSFNTEIVRIEAESLLFVIGKIYGAEIRTKFEDQFKALSKLGEKNFGQKAAGAMGELVLDVAQSLASGVALAYFKSITGMP